MEKKLTVEGIVEVIKERKPSTLVTSISGYDAALLNETIDKWWEFAWGENTDFLRTSIRELLHEIVTQIESRRFPHGTPGEWEAGINNGFDDAITIIKSRI